MVEKSDLPIVLGLLFLGFWFSRRPGGEVLLSFFNVVPVVIVLVWIAQPVRRYFKLRASSYLVTDRRVVVRVRGKETTAQYLTDLGPPQLAEREDGTGTITFDATGGFFSGFGENMLSRRASETSLPELIGIEGARRVRDLIATAQHPPR